MFEGNIGYTRKTPSKVPSTALGMGNPTLRQLTAKSKAPKKYPPFLVAFFKAKAVIFVEGTHGSSFGVPPTQLPSKRVVWSPVVWW